ncbi:hypothetical protein EXIGLDRAFT_833551 [Exidia glandulosa HHB12029]|uniref:Uncharacterized protein n=1 Tax=Exidia glandulosa HHB12029 TaxID=1314781 RepID=A0A165KN45_EXIGL|nr:hypothetical protein EXIGLDRAFT_833551 [Exidia glandulosa HHB12029]
MLARLTSRLLKRDSGPRIPHTNASSSCASRLPPEILLCIFGYLRRVPPDWTTMMSLILANHRPEHISNTLRDLRATCLVCRAWRDCAATLLYSSVYLRTARQLYALLRTLNHRPASSALVRSIRLPDETRELPEHPPVSRLFSPRKRRLRNIARAVDTLLARCAQTTEIVFRVNTPNMASIHGFFATAAQLERVEFAAGPRDTIARIFRDPVHLRFPRGSLLADPPMKQLTLQGLFLGSTNELYFPELRSLHVHFCASEPGWLRNLLEHSPKLEVLYIESLFVAEMLYWDVDELRAGAASLRELRLDWSRRDIGMGFGFLARLAVLEISLRCLTREDVAFTLPPTLETLILSSRGLIFRSGTSRNTLLTAVAKVKRKLHGWKFHDTPRLSTLRLTGDVYGSRVLRDWAMVSFLFGPYCRGVNVDFEVSLLYVWALYHRYLSS